MASASVLTLRPSEELSRTRAGPMWPSICTKQVAQLVGLQEARGMSGHCTAQQAHGRCEVRGFMRAWASSSRRSLTLFRNRDISWPTCTGCAAGIGPCVTQKPEWAPFWAPFSVGMGPFSPFLVLSHPFFGVQKRQSVSLQKQRNHPVDRPKMHVV